MGQLKEWLEAFYSPCKVEILPSIFDTVLLANKSIATKKNSLGKT
tara:strand:+ start:205 stop:339 length:135 start_codon:yes stop_codon:yes gene_type:complete